MALTAWETEKVVGGKLEEMGKAGEEFEDANPGEKWKPSKEWLLSWSIDFMTKLGVEVLD